MRIVFAGTPEPALPSLRRLLDSPHHDVVAVLTRPDAAKGRHGKPTPSPVAQLALEHDIPVLRPTRPNSDEFIAELTALAPDACGVVAYGALLSERLLAVPAHGWVNLHFSLLPAWRGAAPVQAAIAAGDAVTGATTFQIELALDSGPDGFGHHAVDRSRVQRQLDLEGRRAGHGVAGRDRRLHGCRAAPGRQ